MTSTAILDSPYIYPCQAELPQAQGRLTSDTASARCSTC